MASRSSIQFRRRPRLSPATLGGMFRRDPLQLALREASALLGHDLQGAQGLARAVFRRGGVLAVSRGGARVVVGLGGVNPGGTFELASVTKPFTAALADALVRSGQLDWDAPVRELGGPLRGMPRPITARALATHTAGLPTHPARAAVTTFTRFHDPYGGMTPTQALSSARRRANRAQAGRFVYSNLGAGVLALAGAYAAGEALSAGGYGRALARHVTGPLGLPGVGLSPAGAVVTPAGLLGSASTTGFGPLAGAGGLFGTAADLLTFGEAHLDGRAGTHWQQVAHPAGRPAHLSGVAPGWMESRGALWHDGVARGTRAALGFAPASGVVAALLVRGGTPVLGARGGVTWLLLTLLGTMPTGRTL